MRTGAVRPDCRPRSRSGTRSSNCGSRVFSAWAGSLTQTISRDVPVLANISKCPSACCRRRWASSCGTIRAATSLSCRKISRTSSPRARAGKRSWNASSWPGSLLALSNMVQLNQVAAGIREHGERHRPGLCRLPCERHALRGQSGELACDVGHLEGGEWNGLRKHRLLKRLAGRIRMRSQGELQVVRPSRRGDRDPSVLADWNVVLLPEAQNLRVKPKGFV